MGFPRIAHCTQKRSAESVVCPSLLLFALNFLLQQNICARSLNAHTKKHRNR